MYKRQLLPRAAPGGGLLAAAADGAAALAQLSAGGGTTAPAVAAAAATAVATLGDVVPRCGPGAAAAAVKVQVSCSEVARCCGDDEGDPCSHAVAATLTGAQLAIGGCHSVSVSLARSLSLSLEHADEQLPPRSFSAAARLQAC